jgi:hypothetical protein
MNEKRLDMVLRTKINEFEFEVRILDISDIESAYLYLLNARKELIEVREKQSLLMLANLARNAATKYWIESDGKRTVQGVSDKPVGMMISLLDVYPQTKKGAVVASEIDISQPAVSRYFTGSLGEHTDYFEETDDGWRLSEEGIHYIAKWLDVVEIEEVQ